MKWLPTVFLFFVMFFSFATIITTITIVTIRELFLLLGVDFVGFGFVKVAHFGGGL